MMLTFYAPAKINLVLEVLGEYGDYHQISSIVQAINLCDVLNLQLDDEISLKCSETGLENDNLITRAAELLEETTRCRKGAQIELCKHIPWGAGLGGGSSDAATTLLALNELWKLALSVTELAHIASKLGSDVPFFIHGGTALVEGRGEKVTPLPPIYPIWFVLLVPPLPRIKDKTKHVYSKLNFSHFTKGQFVRTAMLSVKQGGTIDSSLMFNVFEKVAFDFFPQLSEYRRVFEEAGAPGIHLTGSGPCLFAPFPEEGRANEVYLRLRKQGLESYVTVSLPKLPD